MSVNKTKNTSRGILKFGSMPQNAKMSAKNFTPDILAFYSIFPYILPNLQIAQLKNCKRWWYVSHCVLALVALRRSVTHPSDCLVCDDKDKQQDNTHNTPFKFSLKRIGVMLKSWVNPLMSDSHPFSCHTPRSNRKETSWL